MHVQDAAEWLVRANVDPRHSPSDASWDLEKLVHQVRLVCLGDNSH